jgi:hypothetical protein
MNKIILITLISAITLTGCGKDRSEYERESGYIAPISVFSPATINEMTPLTFATKRGFDDYNCDGISDMIAMKDSTGFFEAQDFKATVYTGFYNKSGILDFKAPNSEKMNLPFRVDRGNWKLDSVKLNKDNCSDVVFTNFRDTSNGEFTIKFAINAGDYQLVPLESKFNNKEYYENGVGGLENTFIEFIHDQQENYYYDDESGVYSYLKQDWCDFNGDGSDDFILMWDSSNKTTRGSMSIMIAYSSEYGSSGYNQFDRTETYLIPNFLYNRSASRVDTADFNGDGRCDIISFFKGRDSIATSIAYFDLEKDSFIPTKTQYSILPKGLDIFSQASKIDTFDRNNDGKDDLNFITERDDTPVMITYYSK